MTGRFAFFKGACTRGIYDNMKTAVETIFVGKERAYNRRFLQMCSHYLVDPVACTPASGWEKGQVENQVGLVRERFFAPRLRVKNCDELNAWLMDQVRCLRQGPSPSRAARPDDLGGVRSRAAEPGAYAGRASTASTALPASVSKTCLVRFDNNKYSVLGERGRPAGRDPCLCRSRSSMRQDGRIVGEHAALLRPRPDDLRSPALRAGAGPQAGRACATARPSRTGCCPAAMEQVRRKLAAAHDGDRQMVEILTAVLERRACRRSRPPAQRRCEQGVHSADVILNILARRRDPARSDHAS